MVLEGYVLTFRGAVSDPNHSASELEATWLVGTEILCDSAPPDSDGISLCEGVLLPTDTEVTLEVRDPNNATGSASVTLEVTPTSEPSAQIVSQIQQESTTAISSLSFRGFLQTKKTTPRT